MTLPQVPAARSALGMVGGSTSDVLDPRTFLDWVLINIGYQLWNGLVEIDAEGNARPELLEEWESPTVTEWIFKVRRDVVFHNGKTLDADDVIYSINLHRGDTRSPTKAVLENVAEVRKLDASRIKITLAAGDADLPATLSDYRLLVVPNGFTDWANPIGTGGYRLENFEPGVRCITRKAGNYWKPNAAHVEAIEIIVINDPVARVNALISGQVDVINRIDGRTANLMKRNARFQVVRSQTGQYGVLAMNCELDPYRNNDIRLALKYAIDRASIVKTVLNGYGTVGNDQPIPPGNRYYDTAPRAARLRPGAGEVLSQEGRRRPAECDPTGLGSGFLGRSRCWGSVPGRGGARRNRARGEAGARRRLLDKCLSEGTVLRFLSRTAERRWRGPCRRRIAPPPARTIRTGAVRISTSSRTRRARKPTRPSVASFTAPVSR